MVSVSRRRCVHVLIYPPLRDLSNVTGTDPLVSVGSISAHTRPVEALDGEGLSSDSATLYSADTMGVLKIWLLERGTVAQPADGLPPRWRATLRENLTHHRTRINQLVLHDGHIWTGTGLPANSRSFRSVKPFL